MNENLFHAIKDFDPVAAVERKHGLDHHSQFNEEQALEMLALGMLQSQAKETALEENNDVFSGMPLLDYIRVIQEMGFEHAMELPIDRGDRQETFYVYAHRKFGIVLHFDTYHWQPEDGEVKVSINSGDFYAAYRPLGLNESNTFYSRQGARLSSGGWESEKYPNWRRMEEFCGDTTRLPEDVFWFGHWDAREGVFAHIASMMKHGTILPQWPAMRRMYLPLFVGNQDYYSEAYKALPEGPGMYNIKSDYINKLNAERAKQAPQWLRDIINNKVNGEHGEQE